MTYLTVAQLALIAGLLWLNSRERASHDQAILDLIASSETERQLLLDRIENPGTVIAPARAVDPAPPEPDEIELMRRRYENTDGEAAA